MEDRIIQNTFNAFWAIKWGKSAQEIDWRTMFALCKANDALELKDAMKDTIEQFKPFINKEEWADKDWVDLVDTANKISRKYGHDKKIMGFIYEVVNYIDVRETKHNRNKPY